MKKIQLSILLLIGIFLSTSLASFSQETQTPASIGEQGIIMPPNRAGEFDCPVNSIFSQPPVSWANAYFSDEGTTNHSQNIFDLFSGLTENIAGITFWGILSDGSGCYPGGPVDFDIAFYQDNAGSVGTLVQSFTISVTPTVTGSIFCGSQILKFDVTLPSSVSLSNGWASVVRKNPGNLPCSFAWLNTTTGDNSFAWNQSGGSYNYQTGTGYNASFCLTGSTAPVPLSNWAIYIGIFLIASFIVFRFRKRLA